MDAFYLPKGRTKLHFDLSRRCQLLDFHAKEADIIGEVRVAGKTADFIKGFGKQLFRRQRCQVAQWFQPAAPG